MKYRIGENIIWEDTGKIKVHNYPPSSSCTYSYITRVYREINKNSLGWREVDGEPIYFDTMTLEQKTLATIMGQAQNALSILCEHENFLIPED